MGKSDWEPQAEPAIDQVLGYLNFSSGARDPQFLANLDRLWSFVLAETCPGPQDPSLPSEQLAPDEAARENKHRATDASAGAPDNAAAESSAAADAAGTEAAGTDAAGTEAAAGSSSAPTAPWLLLRDRLRRRLGELAKSSTAFEESQQAEAILELAFDPVLQGYFEFHGDLLFHQSPETLCNGFFLGLLAEATLRQGGPWDETERITAGAITYLNDFIGYRPVPTLESQRHEPYPHERIRPVPLFMRQAGVAHGPYREVVQLALQLLEETDRDLLQLAHFDPERLEELAFDPRAYDFEHPVNKRPNHHFGLWDPDTIDGSGHYTRFVVQQVTLDALTRRLAVEELPREELLFEAAAVLAGTILMAAGVSGNGPGAHDSNVTLSTLLPAIAAYRDRFYERLFEKVTGAHAERLQQEARERRQPFGGARQHLNAELARARAAQLEHVHLAMIYGRMGYPDAALRQANVVPVASARMICQIECALDAVLQDIEAGQLPAATEHLPKIRDLLKRGIECGAIIDPWNILGFDGNFSLFPAIENSVRDHRADELVGLVEQVMAIQSRLWSEAAAADEQDLADAIQAQFKGFTDWWRQFAAHEVNSVDAVDASVVYQAAEHVARALRLWHQGGAASGDVAFWAGHTEIFDSPKAYALVVDALLQRGDDVASMAILIHWLSQAEEIGLEEGDSSFHLLAEHWMARHYQRVFRESLDQDELVQINRRVRKLFDFLEANADQYWQVPSFELGPGIVDETETGQDLDEDFDAAEDDKGTYSAAWIDVVYRDSTDDGQEGSIYEGPSVDFDELEEVTAEISERLEFITTLSILWKYGAGIAAYRAMQLSSLAVRCSDGDSAEAAPGTDAGAGGTDARELAVSEFPLCYERCEALTNWIRTAAQNRESLCRLMEEVRNYPLPQPGGDHDSMVEYDRQRLTKESLLERIIASVVGYDDAMRWLLAAYEANRAAWEVAGQKAGIAEPEPLPTLPDVPSVDGENRKIIQVFAAALQRDRETVAARFPEMLKQLKKTALLYVPLAKGGNPHEIVAARGKQQALQELLVCLPRLGLLVQTRELLEAARDMERSNPVGHGAVTEFDELFKIGYTAMVESLVYSSQNWDDASAVTESGVKKFDGPSALFDCVERITETMLVTWLAHSKTLRLSVLEKVSDKASWDDLVGFIKRYGKDLFTQRFFNLGNLRAILHQGVDAWLEQLEEDPADYDLPLLDELGSRLPREQAVQRLTLVLEAIIENYTEYRDYNSTTTQSDQGELLYMLLDFLRLRTQYDRVAWHLKPVVWSHATLVRHGEKQAARLWRRALTERLGDEPDKYLKRLSKLQSRYAMRMPTVADRLSERFIQPLQIDRIKALVEPAMKDPSTHSSRRVFELLEHEVDVLTREPSGVGLDIPPWLASLEEEVDHVRQRLNDLEIDPWGLIEPVRLGFDTVRGQLHEMKAAADGDV